MKDIGVLEDEYMQWEYQWLYSQPLYKIDIMYNKVIIIKIVQYRVDTSNILIMYNYILWSNNFNFKLLLVEENISETDIYNAVGLMSKWSISLKISDFQLF